MKNQTIAIDTCCARHDLTAEQWDQVYEHFVHPHYDRALTKDFIHSFDGCSRCIDGWVASALRHGDAASTTFMWLNTRETPLCFRSSAPAELTY